jgi:hypothetical protein
MKWVTHILWGIATLSLFGVDIAAAAAASAVHTAVTDAFGHAGLRRNKYHDLISILTAVVISVYFHNLAVLALGLEHIALDAASPGRLAVSWAYNAVWSLPAILIMIHLF